MNFSDVIARQGMYQNLQSKPPCVLGSEAAGVVTGVGEEVTAFKVTVIRDAKTVTTY